MPMNFENVHLSQRPTMFIAPSYTDAHETGTGWAAEAVDVVVGELGPRAVQIVDVRRLRLWRAGVWLGGRRAVVIADVREAKVVDLSPQQRTALPGDSWCQ